MNFAIYDENRKLIERLERSVKDGRVSHAYLFEGPGNVDKLDFAKSFIKGVLCPPQMSPDARGENCGRCELCEKIEKLSDDDFLVIAGSMPSKAPKDTLERILKAVPEGVKVVVDMTGDRLKKALKFKPFLIKPNLEELCQATGKELKTIEEITKAAEKLHKDGAENVIVSMGADGALLLDKTGNVHHCKAPAGKALGAFGAGDSMTAGFIKGFMDEHDAGYALKLGVAAGSAAVFEGKLPEYDEIMKVFDEV